MSQSLFDDLARLSAAPMSRAQALRLMGRAIVGAAVTLWAPRRADANSCATTACAPAAPTLCCIDFPTNPNASISACCKLTERCCKFFTPEGAAFASVTCCGPNQVCTKLNPPMEAAYCLDCPPGSVACGSEPCCPVGYSCLASGCCPPTQVCGAVCCLPTEDCVNGACTAISSTCQFTDNPLVATTTTIKAAHIVELRSCIRAGRARWGLSPFNFTDSSLNGVLVKAVHVTELRSALRGAYIAAGLPAPTYTNATLTPQQTVIKAVDIQELRTKALALP